VATFQEIFPPKLSMDLSTPHTHTFHVQIITTFISLTIFSVKNLKCPLVWLRNSQSIKQLPLHLISTWMEWSFFFLSFLSLFHLSLINIAAILIKMQMQISSSSKDVQSTDITHVPNKNLVLSREGIIIHFTIHLCPTSCIPLPYYYNI
jgi:hypothetical protein